MSELKLATDEQNREKPFKPELYLRLTIYDVPASLIKEFQEHVASSCEGGLSPAIKDVMWKAVQKAKETKQELL